MDFRLLILVLCFAAVSAFRLASSSPEFGVCDTEFEVLISRIEAKCSRSLYPNPPLEVDGDYLDRAMESKLGNGYLSVLFYASWCPFSRAVKPKFDALASMFPQVDHLIVEESRALPSVFSRYGIHSMPSILIANQTLKLRYHGDKDISSLIQFYEKTTGLHPIQFIAEREQISLITRFSIGSSTREIVKKDPYLSLAFLFLVLKLTVVLFPRMMSRVKAVWASYVPLMNLGVFGDMSQRLGQVLYMIDVRRVWMKLRLTKTRNFHERAKNAQAWASPLASVSLGNHPSSSSS